MPGLVYYYVDPAASRWAPKCWFHALTTLQCPACGGQRALHEALHLRFGAALAYNPFLLLAIPYALMLAFLHWVYTGDGLQWLRRWCFHPTTVRIYAALFVAWWVVRNIFGW